MKIYLAQIDTTVGDLEGNTRRILAALSEGRRAGASLVVLPELTLTGYPPRDLLERRAFIEGNLEALQTVARAATQVAAIVGFVEPNRTSEGRGLYNCAALCAGGSVVRTVAKRLLPTYDVFDEDRHFEPGREPGLIEIGGTRVGLSVCEDAWTDPTFFGRRLYSADPIGELAAGGARLFINISASPFALGRASYRETLLAGHASKHRTPMVYVNLVGGNDELLFDGRSFVLDAQGRKTHQLASFREDAALVDTEALGPPLPASESPVEDEAFSALVMGTRDYAAKCGFGHAVIGLSGGIDSSLVAAIAVEALGKDAVTGVAMPSRYSSPGSVSDAQDLAKRLGIDLMTFPIEGPFASYLATLKEAIAGAPSVTEENLQSRIRGTLLMALSNTFGWLVLTTGNKSEMAVGYCTLYGDMSGGLAVLSDVPKTLVYRIARGVASVRRSIPQAVFDKPPSAELRPGQLDRDSLPPYEILDEILRMYVEELRPVREIIAAGFDEPTVRDVVRRVDGSEYKRKQAPPGLRITSKAFGLGRRMPIAKRYVEP